VTTIVLRAFLIWLLIAVAEVLHGILRVRLLNRRVGDHHARQIGVFTGSAIILGITWFSVPWLGASTIGQLLVVGFVWLMLMLALEVAFGRLVFRASWQRLAAEFDFRKGGLLSIGMAVLLVARCSWRNCAVWSDWK
jgi:peptidoglycan biosynthesis protein MviN/MurJ (putative lipid II flippase)